MKPNDESEPGASAGVILQDGAGDYFAIPQAALRHFRVAGADRAAVEAFLEGDEVRGFSLPLHSAPPFREEDGAPARSPPPPRTSQRADTLWLISR